MEYAGTIRNGTVVFDTPIHLTDGERVTVVIPARPADSSFELTNQRMHEILEQEDIKQYAHFFLHQS